MGVTPLISGWGWELFVAPSYFPLYIFTEILEIYSKNHFYKLSLHQVCTPHIHLMCCFGGDTNAACCLLRVRESVFCATLSLLQDVDIRQSRQHGIRTTDPLRHVDKGTMESFASLINNHTTKYEVTLIAQPTGVTQQSSGTILRSIASNTCYIVHVQHQYALICLFLSYSHFYKLRSDYRQVHSVFWFTLLPSCCDRCVQYFVSNIQLLTSSSS